MSEQGPWVVVTQKSLDEITGGKLEVISVEQTEERARLLAAAPELLDVAEDLLAEYHELFSHFVASDLTPKACAAIAKARGQAET